MLNQKVGIELTYKSLYSDDRILGQSTTLVGEKRLQVEFTVSACNGVRFTRNRMQELSLNFEEPGTYDIDFISGNGEVIKKSISVK